MIRLSHCVALLCLLSGLADAAPQKVALRPGRVMSAAQVARFTKKLIERERNFYRPGVGYDGLTGLTFDGHAIDQHTGKLSGSARIWSAASKESLHVILLVKAIEGDPTAQALITPDLKRPELAVAVAAEVLGKKIASYRKFDRDYPGYGGFLPWYKIENGKVSPTSDWTDRVPGLDNGQLAWSLYHAKAALERHGYGELAAEYGAHLELMKKNVVRIFYDPAAQKLRAESRLVAGNALAPHSNHYVNNQANYFLDDPYEGLLLCHFADLFGDWRGHPDGKEAIWKEPRRKPAVYGKGRKKITVVEGNWLSSHENWGPLVLPFLDVPIAKRLYKNEQKVRTDWSAKHGWPGLFASTSEPNKDGNPAPGYLSALGVPSVAKEKVSRKRVFTPYAAFPLALIDKPMFATWLHRMLMTPRMWGENGMGESFSLDGAIAPLLTWDGKALPIIALMGGISADIGAQLRRDGLYDHFLARTRADYARFDGARLHGEALSLTPPTM